MSTVRISDLPICEDLPAADEVFMPIMTPTRQFSMKQLVEEIIKCGGVTMEELPNGTIKIKPIKDAE